MPLPIFRILADIAEGDRLAKARENGEQPKLVSAHHDWRRVERGEIDIDALFRNAEIRAEAQREARKKTAARELNLDL